MPRKVAIPPQLSRTAFRTNDADFHGITRARLLGADVTHPFHGVAAVGVDTSSIFGRCLAYEPLLTGGQLFSHTTAARLYGMPLPPANGIERDEDGGDGDDGVRDLPDARSLHISVLGPVSAPRGTGIVGHSLTAGDVERANVLGLPVVSVGDIRCHLAVVLSREDLVASGLPEPLVNRKVLVDGGKLALHPDLSYERWRVVFDYEGDGHRTSKRRFRQDIERRELFESAGWRVTRVSADDVFRFPEKFIARVRRILREREVGHPSS